jgi:hypothetical protein
MRLLKLRYLLMAIPAFLVLGAAGVWMAKTLSPTQVTVPAGTEIEVRINQSLASNVSRPGERFDATVAAPVAVKGQAVIPAGSRVEGVVVDVRESGRLKGAARLSLAINALQVKDRTYEVHSSDVGRYGRGHEKRNWGYIGGGAGSGALVGALAAGGKGALIGGPVGAAAGVAVAALTGKHDIKIPAETVLVFELSQPVAIVVSG